MDAFFNDFNDLQLNAIKCEANKICVYAGPGTGKTKTLVGKYTYLLKEMGVLSANILCLTFTKKAADEMDAKIRKVCGENPSKYIGTIHSMANKILSEDIYRIGFPNKYSIITDDDQHSILFDAMNEMNLYEDDNITYKDLITFINESKEAKKDSYFKYLVNKSLIELEIQKINEEILKADTEDNLINLKKEKVYYVYLLSQANNYFLDFLDLILITIYIFKANKYVLKKRASKFRYILVDEFQDLTENEYELICYLASSHGRIFAVGDPDQSIYRFRGSKVSIFNDFYRDCDEHFDFTENYRSYQEIIDLSHDLISTNTDRITDIILHCNKGSHSVPKLIHTEDRYSEAMYIADKIQDYFKKGVKRSECAILYRSNQCSLIFEEYFQLRKIPYKVYSNNEFFKCDEIKTAISYLKFIIYRDNISFLSIYKKPVRYISKIMLNRIKELASNNRVTYWQVIKDDYKNPIYKNNFNKFVEFVETIEAINPNEDFEQWCLKVFNDSGFLKYVFSTGDEDKANHIKQLNDMIHSFEPDDPNKNIAEEFLNYLALLSDGDIKNEEDKVQMMSIHCSKGMQYRYVFLVDFNEGYIPSSKTVSKEDVAEERRIAYVAFTRAKDELYILESKGDDGHAVVSSFSNSFKKKNYLIEQYIAPEKKDIKSITVGSYVKSKFYGNGIVLHVDSLNKKCLVKFDDYYKEKEVDLVTLINVVKQNKLSFDIDTNLVEKIKKENNFKYSVGDIVIHNEYGAGIITKIKDKSHAYIQFREIGSIFDLDSNNIINRNEYIKYIDKKGDIK